jgi:hypothetical protein
MTDEQVVEAKAIAAAAGALATRARALYDALYGDTFPVVPIYLVDDARHSLASAESQLDRLVDIAGDRRRSERETDS